MSLSDLAALAIVATAALRAWLGWLDLKRLELSRSDGGGCASLGGGDDLRNLRQRIRRLEGITIGVDG